MCNAGCSCRKYGEQQSHPRNLQVTGTVLLALEIAFQLEGQTVTTTTKNKIKSAKAGTGQSPVDILQTPSRVPECSPSAPHTPYTAARQGNAPLLLVLFSGS